MVEVATPASIASTVVLEEEEEGGGGVVVEGGGGGGGGEWVEEEEEEADDVWHYALNDVQHGPVTLTDLGAMRARGGAVR